MDEFFGTFFGSTVVSQQLAYLEASLLKDIWETFYSTVLSTFFAYVIGLPLGIILVTGEPDGVRPLPRALMRVINVIVNLLGTIGFVMPLIGFLGTVLGMMRAFQVAANAEALSAERISEAVNMALITTASALVVAIPCYIAYNYLVARVNSITLDMEKASLEIMNFFERREAEKTGALQHDKK